ncbi:MAG: UDP-glucose/GDP-mannose dehydrogenase family protein [Anaerolineae bacterium]|nr:UDP-glucose/GDP-mannose dehydrogenase family protein [Anaerolineae bacterium]
MKISIFGLGYVGCVTAACLAHDGHTVLGVDVNPLKVDLVGSGRSPLVEPGLEDMMKASVASGNLKATLDSHAAIQESDVSLICVGTPSHENGNLELSYVKNVCSEIGKALTEKEDYHVVVIRSTVLPGTVEECLIPILEQESGLKAGVDFGVCMNPEFLRESTAIADYFNPSFIVIGQIDERSGAMVHELYKTLEAPSFRTPIRTAEMIKYSCNAFHALKITFANEIGNLCKAHGIDGQDVMHIFGHDQQLNISTTYLKPGYAFGGSCLPKDVRALVYRAKERDVESSLLRSILSSNQNQIDLGIKMVERTKRKKVGILGLSFKPSTDDLRESPAIELVETLVGKGYQVQIFDENVQLSRLIGANKSFIEKELPHIASLMSDSLEELVAEAEVVVITHGSKTFKEVPNMMTAGQTLIDLVGIAKNKKDMQGQYEGICW